MLKKRWLLALGFLTLLLTSCSHAPKPKQKLIVTGSSTIAPLMTEIAKHFEQEHPQIRVDVQAGGSGRGIADVRSSRADIGMVSRNLKAAEKDLIPYPIAADGVAFMVHKTNSIPPLSRQQIVEIYTGKIRDWKDVGGKNGPITVVNKAEGRATLDLFLDFFHLKNSQIRADVIIGHNEEAIKVVSGNPRAIGYVSIGAAARDLALGVPIRLLSLEGVAPSAANVQSKRYPLLRVLNLVVSKKPQGAAAALIHFAQSPQVHEIIRKEDYVPYAR